MTKTSTPQQNVNASSAQLGTGTEASDHETDLFYDQIKDKLNDLLREPSEETIENILAYSRL